MKDQISEDKIEKIENQECVLYSDGTLVHKKRGLKKLNAISWVFIIFFSVSVLISWIQFFDFMTSLQSEYFENNKWGFVTFVVGFSFILETIVVRNWFKKSKKPNEPSKFPFTIGIHAFLLSFLVLFSFTFFLASTPAPTPVSLCYALRPWWCWFNILFSSIPALFMGLVTYFASKNSFK